MIDVDALIAEVQKTKGVVPSVVAFINNLKTQLSAELANDPAAQAKLDAALQELVDSNQELAAAIQANP